MIEPALDYALRNSDKFVDAFQRHLLLVALPLLIGIVVGLPLGLECAIQNGVDGGD